MQITISFNVLKRTAIRLLLRDFHRWQSQGRLAFEIRQKFKGFGAKPTIARYIYARLRGCVDASALSVENVPKVNHFPLVPIPWRGRVERPSRNQTCSKKNTERSSKKVKELNERKNRRKKKREKHSRKDIASYASDERGVTLEISERQDANGARGRKSRRWGEGKNILARKKVIHRSASRDRLKGRDGVLACGERKSRFEKMKFVPRRIPVSIFTVCMCSHVCTRARVFHVSAWSDYFYRAPRHAWYFSLPINHAARMAKTNLNSTIERAWRFRWQRVFIALHECVDITIISAMILWTMRYEITRGNIKILQVSQRVCRSEKRIFEYLSSLHFHAFNY